MAPVQVLADTEAQALPQGRVPERLSDVLLGPRGHCIPTEVPCQP